jgi:hypothetical protein
VANTRAALVEHHTGAVREHRLDPLGVADHELGQLVRIRPRGVVRDERVVETAVVQRAGVAAGVLDVETGAGGVDVGCGVGVGGTDELDRHRDPSRRGQLPATGW